MSRDLQTSSGQMPMPVADSSSDPEPAAGTPPAREASPRQVSSWIKFNRRLGRRLRRRRFADFKKMVDELKRHQAKVRILDVGGVIGYWTNSMKGLIDLDGLEITVMNLEARTALKGVDADFDLESSPFVMAEGNACDMVYADGAFDIVHCNSVMEHVGDWANQVAAAREIRRVAKRYYVQTPYLWFPYEPHFMRVGFHWLPEQMRARILMRKKLGWHGPFENYDAAIARVRSVQLLDAKQMHTLFPDAQQSFERFIMVKSLIAIR